MAERMQIERKDEFHEVEGASIPIRRGREQTQTAPTDTNPGWIDVGVRALAARMTSGSMLPRTVELAAWACGLKL